MTIYLVRWFDLTASLVRAEDEGNLIEILDQVANPDGCEWSEYHGPLFVDFSIPAEVSIINRRPGEPVAPEQLVVGDLGPMTETSVVDALELSLAGGDDGIDTGNAVLSQAFPFLNAAIEKDFNEQTGAYSNDGVLPEADLRKALHDELTRLRKGPEHSMQFESATDRYAKGLLDVLDMPVDLVRRYVKTKSALREPSVTGHQRRSPSAAAPPEPPEHPQLAERTDDSLFKVRNHHVDECGQPPVLDGDKPESYVGYFVNEQGEQSVYVFDYQTNEATLQTGAAGWSHAHPIVNGEAEGLQLSRSELAWLQACWIATGGLS